MSKPSICAVVPTIREAQMAEFRKAWAPLFKRHSVTLITVWDGEVPVSEFRSPLQVVDSNITESQLGRVVHNFKHENADLFCRKTDAVRNLGFVQAAVGNYEYILTLDDDVHPPAGSDPIQEHLDVLQRRVPISWMNTAMDSPTLLVRNERCVYETGRPCQTPYLRGFPYGIRDEAPVKVSHGVWVNVPDFDGRTQLELGKCSCDGGTVRKHGGMVSDVPCPKCNGTGYDGSRLPYSLPYFRGPVPKGTYLPFCGMNVMVHRDALPYLYFAPMGPDSGVVTDCTHCGFPGRANAQHEDCCPDGLKHSRSGLNRFADIWMGLLLKRQMDALGWAIYTGASTVIHTRQSDSFKNVEQEKLGIEWNEWAWKTGNLTYSDLETMPDAFVDYWRSYLNKADRFRKLIQGLQSK